MFKFTLSQRAGLAIAGALTLLGLIVYGAGYQYFGLRNGVVLILIILAMFLSVVHFRRPPEERRSSDSDALGWHVLALLLALIYAAQAAWHLEEDLIQGPLILCVFLQIVNYVLGFRRRDKK